MALTPWFPGDVKPVHVGMYERDFGWGHAYSYWNGEFWGQYCRTVSVAYASRGKVSFHQQVPWRGLTEPAQQENKQ